MVVKNLARRVRAIALSAPCCCALLLLTFSQATLTADNFDPCATKAKYEAAQKAAREAEAKASAIPLPPLLKDDSGSNGNFDINTIKDPQAQAEEMLRLIEQKIQEEKPIVMVNNRMLTMQQAKAEEEIARKNFDAMAKARKQKMDQLSRLDIDIADARNDMAEVRNQPGYAEIGKVAAIQKTITAQENYLSSKMPGVPLENFAQLKTAAQTFEFSNDKIKDWKTQINDLKIVETTANQAKIRQIESLIAGEVKRERDAVVETLANWNTNKGELAGLDPQGNIGDLWKQAQGHQKNLADKVAEKARVQLQEPSESSEKEIYQKYDTVSKRLRALETLQSVEKSKATLETWLKARKERDAAEANRLKAGADYNKALQAKSDLLAEAKAAFQSEEARIKSIKETLTGKPHDAEFYKKLRDLKEHGLKTYKPLQTRLDLFDCFSDAREFNDEKLTPRIRVLEKIVIAANTDTTNGGRVLGAPPKAKTPPRVATKPKTPAVKVVEWVRKDPVFYSADKPNRMPKYLEVSKTSLTYTTEKDGKTYTNTMTWDEPPATIKQGQTVTLKMSSSAQQGWANVGGWFNLRNINRSTVTGHNGAGSSDNWRKDSPHSGSVSFKTDYAPRIEVSAGHDPAPDTWVVIIWDYAPAK